MPPPIKFKTFRELLTPDQIRPLRTNALRLYSSIFNAMEFRGTETILMGDDVSAGRAKITLHELADAKQQLNKHGLMLCEDIPPGSTRYKFISDYDDTN